MRGKVGRARAGERKRWACLSAEWRDAISFRQARNYLSVRRKNRVLWRGYRPFVDPLYLGFQSLSRSPAGWPSRQDLGVLKVDGGSGGGTGHSLTHPLTCEEGGRGEAEAHRPTAAFPFLRIPKNVRPNCRVVSERANELPIISIVSISGSARSQIPIRLVQTAVPLYRMLTGNSSGVRLYFQLPQAPQQRGVLGFVGRRLQQRHVELGLRRAQRHAHHVRVHGRPRPHESLPQPGDTRRRQRRPRRSRAAPKAVATEQEAANRPAAGR